MTTTATATVQRYAGDSIIIHVHAPSGYERYCEGSEEATREHVEELHASGVQVLCWCGETADHWETGASSDAAVPGPRCGDHALDAEPLDPDALDPDAPERVEEAAPAERYALRGHEAAALIDALDGAELERAAQHYADALGAALELVAPVRVTCTRLRRGDGGALVRGEYRTHALQRSGEHRIGLDVRAPRSIRPYVLAHELVHALQAERARSAGSTFAAYVAPQCRLPYAERPFEAEARALGLALAGSMIDQARPFSAARGQLLADGGAGLEPADLERCAAALERADIDDRVADQADDDPADAVLADLAAAGLEPIGERVADLARARSVAALAAALVAGSGLGAAASGRPGGERTDVRVRPGESVRVYGCEAEDTCAIDYRAGRDGRGVWSIRHRLPYPPRADRVEEAEREPRPLTAAARVAPTWCTRSRSDVTFSLADPVEAAAALGVALGAVSCTGSGGATVSPPLVGYWRGVRETAYRVELIGADAHERALAVCAELVERTSCEAIQLESWHGDAYRAREIRAREERVEERVEEAEREPATGPERRAAAVRLARHLRDAAQLAEDGAPASALAVARAAAEDWRAVVHGTGAPERVCEAAALAPVAGRSRPLGARSGRVVAPELARLDAAAQRALAALDRRPSPRQLARLRRTCTAALAARLAGASAETVAAGRSWYPSAQLAVERIAARTGLAADRVAAAVAALSPRKHWADNLRAAERLAVAVAAGAEPPSVHFGRQQAAALGALRGELAPEEAATGPKVAPFRRAISGDPSALVLDTWAARAAGLPESALTRRPVRAVLVEAYGLAADAAGLAVRDAQAVAWLAVRGVVPSDPDGFRVEERVEEAERAAANLAPGVSTAHAHFYPPDDPPPYLVCEDPACGYGADADTYRYEEDPQCPRCASPLDPAEELPAERVEEAARAIAVELSPSSYLPAARRAIVGAVSYRRRAIRVEPHEHGPRVYVLDRRMHHGPPALLAAAVLIGAGRYRAASVALLWAAEDARDFPWTDGRNHAPTRRAIRPLRVLVSLTLTTLTARSDRS